MGRENGGNGGRAQMNFINVTMDMFASMYEMEGPPRLPGGLVWSTLYFELHISAHLHVIHQQEKSVLAFCSTFRHSILYACLRRNRCADLVDKTYTTSSTSTRQYEAVNAQRNHGPAYDFQFNNCTSNIVHLHTTTGEGKQRVPSAPLYLSLQPANQ